VTYLQQGSTYRSTIQLTVNNLPWTEVASFYGQRANATFFVTCEDNNGKTHVMFGDGVNGARLPTGVNNVVVTYRVGAGAASPPAGKLTVIATSFPGLRSVLNPVAVGGGADADPPAQIQRYAPRSVLTFGRAVSVFDYQALAAQVPGVTRAGAVWGWDDARQRAMVQVYVGDDAAAAAAAQTALAAAGDPNRPVKVTQATEIYVALAINLVVTPEMDIAVITAAVATALTDTEAGLFGAWNMSIGQTVFASQIEAAVLGVTGAVAIIALTFTANGVVVEGPIFNPGEGAYFTLDPADIDLTTEPGPNG
jgi:predicted phage baseplate assembly protein